MIAVIDVCGTNISSLANALTRLNKEFVLTHEPQQILAANHVILPGVGTAGFAMRALVEHRLIDLIPKLTQPVLGICSGMQLLFESSEEGQVSCLGIIQGQVVRLKQQKDYPIPHMGWNQLRWTQQSPLQVGLADEAYLYFVHSFGIKDQHYAIANCQYSEIFAAIVQKNNFIGMQFHPEKSGNTGSILLNNFCSM